MNGALRFNSIEMDGNSAWGISTNTLLPCLFRMDLTEMRINALAVIPCKHDDENHLYIKKINELLVMAPYFGRGEFLVYDIHKKIFSSIDIGIQEKVTFVNGTRVGNKLLFFQAGTGLIYEYFYHDGDILICDKLNTEVSRVLNTSTFDYNITWNSVLLMDRSVFIPIFDTRYIFEMNIDSYSVSIHRLPGNFKIQKMTTCGGKLICTSKDRIAEFDYTLDDFKELKSQPGDHVCNIFQFFNDNINSLVTVNYQGNAVYCNKNGILCRHYIQNENHLELQYKDCFNEIEIYTDSIGDLYLMDYRHETVQRLEMTVDKEELLDVYKSVDLGGRIYKESECTGIDVFIDMLDQTS